MPHIKSTHDPSDQSHQAIQQPAPATNCTHIKLWHTPMSRTCFCWGMMDVTVMCASCRQPMLGFGNEQHYK
jgi:hypothetical protein